MIFDKIRLIGNQTIDLPIAGVSYADKFIVKSIDGLGPPDIDVIMGKTLYNGDVYQGSFARGREIVIYIRLNPNYSIGETPDVLREQLYSLFFTQKSSVDIQIMHGATLKASTLGYGKKFEAVPFGKNAEVQLTFACPQPFFSYPSEINFDVATLDKIYPVVTNIGNVSVGFKLVMTIADVDNRFIFTDPVGKMLDVYNYQFAAGDVLTVNTIAGAREVSSKRGNAVTSLIPYLRVADWLEMAPGSNRFNIAFYPSGGPMYTYNSWSYTPLYLGV